MSDAKPYDAYGIAGIRMAQADRSTAYPHETCDEHDAAQAAPKTNGERDAE